MGRKIFGVLVLLGVAVYGFVYSGIGSKVTPECRLSPAGEGQCQFTNTGWTAGTYCARVGIENRHSGAFAGTGICSGIVWPSDSVHKPINVLIPPGHCGNGLAAWGDACTLEIKNGDAGDDTVASRSAEASEQPTQENAVDGFSPLRGGGQITQGRCHMGECSWVKWKAVTVAGRSKDSINLQADVLTGSSSHAEAEQYPHSADGVAIDWQAASTPLQITCSRTAPSVDGQPLPLHPDGIYGYQEWSAEMYFAACHSHLQGYPSGIERFGYNVQ